MTRRTLTAEIIRPSELGAAEQSLWQEWRGADAALSSPFCSFEYAHAVGEVHPGARIAVLIRGGEVKAFLPFQHPGAIARAAGYAEPVGGAMTDAVGAVAAPDFETTPLELLGATRLSSFLFTHLVAGQRRCGLVPEQLDPGLAIDLTAGPDYWDELRRTRPKVISQLERRRRRAEEELGPLALQWQPENSLEALEWLITLKRAQYRRTGVVDALRSPWRRNLIRRLSRCESPECTGRVFTLSAGGRVLAAHFALRNRTVLQGWFPAYDVEFSRFSPGRLLLAAVIDAAHEHGISRIERGLGTARAKRDFANVEVAYGRGLLLQPGPRGAAVRLALAAGWRWRSLVSGRPALGGGSEAVAGREAESGVCPAKSIPLGP